MYRLLIKSIIPYRNYHSLVNKRACFKITCLPLCTGKVYFAEQKLPVNEKLKISDLISTDFSHKSQDLQITKINASNEVSWKTMKYTFLLLGICISFAGMYIILGFEDTEDDGGNLQDESPNKPIILKYIYRILKEFDYYKRLIREPSRDKLLPDELKFPYCQPKYTLVLELTDVLVHPDWTYQTGWRFKKRPGIDHFLETLSGTFEIVIYTAEQGMTVFPIIEALDPKNLIMYKLVRDATHFVDGIHVKDLDKLNRNLQKVIVVDWNMNAVKFHPDNVFHIPRWTGKDDLALIDLTAFLMTISNSEVEDVRDVLKYYNKFDDGLAAFRDKQRLLLEQQQAEKNTKSPSPLPATDWTRSFVKQRTGIV